jgi:hypothetical protein
MGRPERPAASQAKLDTFREDVAITGQCSVAASQQTLLARTQRREAGRSEVDGDVEWGGRPPHGGELLLGTGDGGLQSFDLAEPACPWASARRARRLLRISSAGPSLGGVGAQQGAAQAGVLVLARRWE